MLLRNVMPDIARTLKGYERQFAALPNRPSQLLLQDDIDMNESEEGDSESESMDVFQFGEDGIVL